MYYISLVVVLLCISCVINHSSGELTNTEKVEFLNRHNYVRQQHTTQQPNNNNNNMNVLMWDDEIADEAQALATKCTTANLKIPQYGYNSIYNATTYATPSSVVDEWSQEAEYYDQQYNQCIDGKICHHYATIVWAPLRLVGCGYATCGHRGYLWTCLYWPRGSAPSQQVVVSQYRINGVVASVQSNDTSSTTSSLTSSSVTTTTSESLTSGTGYGSTSSSSSTTTSNATTSSTSSLTSSSSSTSSASTSSSAISSSLASSSSTSSSSTSPSTSTSGAACCPYCPANSICVSCVCECLPGFSGEPGNCVLLGDPNLPTSRWDYLQGDPSTWSFTLNNSRIFHVGGLSAVVWTDISPFDYGTGYCWLASITPFNDAVEWGLLLNSLDSQNGYVIRGTPQSVQFGVNYQNTYHYWSISQGWATSYQKELMVCTRGGEYYNIYINSINYPLNTTYTISALRVGGVVGLVANGVVAFDYLKFVSSDFVTVRIAECTTSDVVSSVLSNVFLRYSSTFTLSACSKKRATSTIIEFQFYGNNSHCAKSLAAIFIADVNSIFASAALTVLDVQHTNNSSITVNSDIVVLEIPPAVVVNPVGEPTSLTTAQIGGIFGGAIGLVIIVLVIVIVIIYRRKKGYRSRRSGNRRGVEMQSMQIPQYPTLDGSIHMTPRKKKPKRSMPSSELTSSTSRIIGYGTDM